MIWVAFQIENYSSSISAMERFVAQKSTDKVRMNDAYMRIGDAHFVSKNTGL
jgi:hypothetical protein